MRVLRNRTIGCEQSHYYYFGFEDYESQAADFDLIAAPINFQELGHDFFKGRRVVQIELEEPNRFFLLNWFNHLDFDQYPEKVFSICPYTTAWLNKKYGRNNRTHVFIPLNPRIIPPKAPKQYDVIYSGHVFPGEISNIVKDIASFKYRLVSNTHHSLVTNRGVDNRTKLELMAATKITLVHNLLFLTTEHIANVRRIGDVGKNKAFDLAASHCIVPQVKGRLFEAAFCRSLILCRRDPFNIIEQYFEPDKEFVYYEPQDLQKTIRKILDNYVDYEPIIQRAFERATSQYTTGAFFEKFLRPIV